MKVVVPIKRAVDHDAKIRVKADGSAVDLAHVKMSMLPFDEIAIEAAVHVKTAGTADKVIADGKSDAACLGDRTVAFRTTNAGWAAASPRFKANLQCKHLERME